MVRRPGRGAALAPARHVAERPGRAVRRRSSGPWCRSCWRSRRSWASRHARCGPVIATCGRTTCAARRTADCACSTSTMPASPTRRASSPPCSSSTPITTSYGAGELRDAYAARRGPGPGRDAGRLLDGHRAAVPHRGGGLPALAGVDHGGGTRRQRGLGPRVPRPAAVRGLVEALLAEPAARPDQADRRRSSRPSSRSAAGEPVPAVREALGPAADGSPAPIEGMSRGGTRAWVACSKS